MKVVRTIAEVRRLLDPLRCHSTVGLVPTMGALHAGHVALLAAARRECDLVVATVFVNPAQFGDQTDLAAYPRDERRDEALAADCGVDIFLAPPVEEVYPAGYTTWVSVDGPADGLEGEFRPGHFRGVATVCLKLFTAVSPDVAFFGQKDAQQVAVITRLVRDLTLDIAIRVIPTVRDVDGLALSSRNVRLSPEERARALAIPRALAAGRAAFEEGRDPVAAARAALDGLDLDYVEVRDFDGRQTLVVAARLGSIRLIDNEVLTGARDIRLQPDARPASKPGAVARTGQTDRRPVTPQDLDAMKRRGDRIVMLTAYDAPSARLAEEAGVDVILVGDSAAMTMLGHESTLPVTVDEMLMLAKAVRRGARRPLVVADMPFGSFQVSDESALADAVRFIKEGGADAVKLEGAGPTLRRVQALTAAGIAVIGHLGLTPQSVKRLGGYTPQGRTAETAHRLLEDARALERAGCIAIVLEAIPPPVALRITRAVAIPTIGIGAGPSCDGQVLVWHDVLGLSATTAPRFVKQYADLGRSVLTALESYVGDVRSGRFPDVRHTYAMPEHEHELFEAELAAALAFAEDLK